MLCLQILCESTRLSFDTRCATGTPTYILHSESWPVQAALIVDLAQFLVPGPFVLAADSSVNNVCYPA